MWKWTATGTLTALSLGACIFSDATDECLDAQECGGPFGPTTSTGGGGGDGGAGGGLPAGCIPSESDGAVADSCGVFVSSSLGDDGTGDGSKAAPYATLGAALAAAGTRAVYACAEGFDEAVSITSGVHVYGGLDCANQWGYVGGATKTALTAPADSIVLRVEQGADGTVVTDFAVTARDAVAAGASSIAVLVDQAEVTFEACELMAGDGADGAEGVTPTGGDLDGDTGDPGADSSTPCANSVNAGGVGGEKICDGSNVDGGLGGSGTNTSVGGNGGPGLGVAPGAIGVGEGTSGQCTGGEGGPGDPGAAGAGATGVGQLASTGYAGVTGEAGQGSGTPGSGGGGGGGANECVAPNDAFAGPSGGGGGSGGCGGLAGGGGQAGGASIALLALGASATLRNCTLNSALGGAGGPGSPGQEGGPGGQGGGADGDACAGGRGGKGGRGGAGGGGLGGHSLGIAHTGAVPTSDAGTSINVGSAGPGGAGGDGGTGNQGGDGADGTAAETLSFD